MKIKKLLSVNYAIEYSKEASYHSPAIYGDRVETPEPYLPDYTKFM